MPNGARHALTEKDRMNLDANLAAVIDGSIRLLATSDLIDD
jgi:hypothetical protein